jgi:LCP family protein required for cell wall assembly
MKLSGNKKNGRYTSDSRRNKEPQVNHHQGKQGTDPIVARPAAKKRKAYRAAKILFAVLAVILAILVTFYVILKLNLRPPDVNDVPKPSSGGSASEGIGTTADMTEPPVRDRTKYTFVILGMDNGFGNTDTMMVATFDDTKYTLNVVNIPRDTLVNVSWSTKKANSFYGQGGTDRVIEGLTDLLGYQVDFYVKVDLDAFSKLIGGIGGVYFDVPKDMNYDDDSQDLHIHLQAGPQLLDGSHALQLVRARKHVWDTGDIGRIETQQAFLKAAAEQILDQKDSISLTTLIDIFLNDVESNITKGNLGWFAKEFLKMDAVNVSFETLPANYYDEVNDDSYCTIKLNDWLNVINTKLNPFDFEVKAEDVSILTRDANGNLYVTNGVWAGKKSWGSGGSSSEPYSSPDVSTKPSASPSPSPSVSPSPSPSSDISRSPDGEDSSPDISPEETGSEALPSPSDSLSPVPSPSESMQASPTA